MSSSRWCKSPLHRYAHPRRAATKSSKLHCRNFHATTSPSFWLKGHRNVPNNYSDLHNNSSFTRSTHESAHEDRMKSFKKLFEEHPYEFLFGRSNRMLRGYGAKGWDAEFVRKVFPQWAWKDLEELGEDAGRRATASRSNRSEAGTSDDGHYRASNSTSSTARSRATTDANAPRSNPETIDPYRVRESIFSEPSYKRAPTKKPDYDTCVVSPSDPRRPPEFTSTSAVGPDTYTPRKEVYNGQGPEWISRAPKPRQPLHKDSLSAEERSGDGIGASEASSRESAFIKEFFAEPPKMDSGGKEWRNTSLDRRSAMNPPKEQGYKDAKLKDQTSAPNPEEYSSTERFWGVKRGMWPPPEMAEARDPKEDMGKSDQTWSSRTEPALKGDPAVQTWYSRKESPAQAEEGVKEPRSSRSTDKILEQLPKDDIDFLTASDIRAAMGRKKNNLSNQPRDQLEQHYKRAGENDAVLDSMIESKIVNDQLIRRTTRELNEKNKSRPEPQSINADASALAQHIASTPEPTEPALESSIDRMTKWLQSGGDAFVKHFWQDPVTEKSLFASDLQMKSIKNAVRAGGAAMELVGPDLETDFPATKPLLQRLKACETMACYSVSPKLWSRSGSDDAQAQTDSLKTLQLRVGLQKTDHEFDRAIKAIETIEKNGLSYSAKNNLRHAFQTLQKNTKLTRRLVFNLHQRLEKSPEDAAKRQFWNVGHQLLALQDIQSALLRLVERIMQIVDVVPIAIAEGTHTEQATSTSIPASHAESQSTTTWSIPAGQKLEQEIEAQKAAMQGLSDDGYARGPGPTTKTSHDEVKPLAHSVFRPFSIQLDRLGKEVDDQFAPGATEGKTKRQSVEDQKLVKEIKDAYEDNYGPITTEHRQTPDQQEKTVELKAQAPEQVQDDPLGKQAVESCDTDVANSSSNMAGIIATESKADSSPPTQKEIEAAAQDIGATGYTEAGVTAEPGSFAATSQEDIKLATESTSTTPIFEEHQDTTQQTVPTSYSYTIIAHDPSNDELSITTTISTPASSPEAISVPEALAILDTPIKFLPHLPTTRFEITSAKSNLLIFRTPADASSSTAAASSDAGSEIKTTKISPPSSSSSSSESVDAGSEGRQKINPVDGTSRLSPTGFVGVDDLREEVRDEMIEFQRLKAAHEAEKQIEMAWKDDSGSSNRAEETEKATEKEGTSSSSKGKKSSSNQRAKEESTSTKGNKNIGRGGGVASVFKTAILAGAACYVAGVIGEVVR